MKERMGDDGVLHLEIRVPLLAPSTQRGERASRRSCDRRSFDHAAPAPPPAPQPTTATTTGATTTIALDVEARSTVRDVLIQAVYQHPESLEWPLLPAYRLVLRRPGPGAPPLLLEATQPIGA